MRTFLSILLTFWITAAFAQESSLYYIDGLNGNDGNNGLSTNNPWQHHPWANGWTGSYSHAPGDQFIFRGGVTVTNPALTVAASGSPTAWDYYGHTNTWFVGSTYSPPVFSYGGTLQTGNPDCVLYDPSYSNFTIDGITCTAYYMADSSYNQAACYLSLIGSSNIEIINCQFTDWRRDPAATLSAFSCIVGPTTFLQTGCYCSNCTFLGNSNTDFGGSDYCFGSWHSCSVSNSCAGWLGGGGPYAICEGCDIAANKNDFTGGHGAGIAARGYFGYQLIYNNRIHDCAELNMSYGQNGGASGPAWMWNNIIYNSFPGGIVASSFVGSANELHVWNNTIDVSAGSSYGVLVEGTDGDTNIPFAILDVQNNIYSGYSISGVTLTTLINKSNTIAFSESDFNALGLFNPKYVPPISSPVVGAGTNLLVEGLLTNSFFLPAASDIFGNARPLILAWTTGAANATNANSGGVSINFVGH
jgi:hypothetical protein